MKILIKQYKHQRVEVASKEFELPAKTEYFFETHIRRAIRISPIFATWMKEKGEEEEIYEIAVTCIYLSGKCMIEKFTLAPHFIEELYYSGDTGGKSEFVRNWINGFFDSRTKEMFVNDLDCAIKDITKGL